MFDEWTESHVNTTYINGDGLSGPLNGTLTCFNNAYTPGDSYLWLMSLSVTETLLP